MKTKWLRSALLDLADITLYISENNPKAAIRIKRLIHQRASELAEMPYAFRVGVVENTRERVVTPYPYVIIYKVDETAQKVVILSVVHTAMKYPQD